MVLIIFLAIFCLYFLPTVLAWRHGDPHFTAATFLMNILVGWTIIGWIVMVVIALIKPFKTPWMKK